VTEETGDRTSAEAVGVGRDEVEHTGLGDDVGDVDTALPLREATA